VMMWETGNELRPPSDWTKEVADYVKSIDNRHLVMINALFFFVRVFIFSFRFWMEHMELIALLSKLIAWTFILIISIQWKTAGFSFYRLLVDRLFSEFPMMRKRL